MGKFPSHSSLIRTAAAFETIELIDCLLQFTIASYPYIELYQLYINSSRNSFTCVQGKMTIFVHRGYMRPTAAREIVL